MDDIEMARPKGLLILFTSFKLLDILDDAAFRHVVNAMRDYVETGSEPEGLEPIEQVAFESQREALDGNIETYRRAITAHREAGRKGGRPKKTDGNQKVFDDNQTEPIGFSEKPNETNSPLKLKTNNYSDTKVSDSNSAEALPPTPKSRFSPPDVETVKSYFAEKGGTEAQAIRFHAYYESNGWKVGRNPMKNWKAAASGWISRDREQQQNKPAPGNTSRSAADVYQASKFDEGLLVYNTPYARRQFYLHPEGECLHGENGLRGSYWGQRALADYGEAIAYIATQAVTTFWGG